MRRQILVVVGLLIIGTATFLAISRAGGLAGVQWTQIGPQPLEIDAEQNYQGNGPDSGEVADIAIDPRGSTDQTIFVATEAGGVWQSNDGGSTWKTTFDQNESLSMGALALDPANPSIVYAGTGNPTNQGFFSGVGVYKSIDDGQTWTLTPMSSGFGGVAIVRMVMPATNVLLTATQGGLARSTTGGNNFTSPTINGVTNAQINDLHLDTATPTTVYASVQGVGIFESTDSGAHWGSNLFTASNGSPLSVANFTPGFISFAQTTNLGGVPNNSRIYASVQNVNSSGAAPNWGLFVSNSGGASWTQATANNNPSNNCSQCGYDQTIGVDPLDGTVLYLGFVDMWVSTDSGANFGEIGHGQVHNDHHALTLSPHTAAATPGHVPFWDGSDGGVALATNQGGTFTAENGPSPGPGQAIASNLFRNIDIGRGSSNNNKFTYGGMQDTGSGEFGDLDTHNTWHLHIDGDGAGTAVDPCNAKNAVIMDDACLQYNVSDPPSWSGATFPGGRYFGGLGFSFGNTVAYDQQCTAGADNGVYASITEWPNPSKPGQGCFGQGSPTQNEIFKSTDGGVNYAQWPTAPSTFSSAVTVIATVKIDPNIVWIGLGDGTVQVSTNATASPPSIGAPAAQPPHNAGASVTAIAIDPTNTQTVVVTYSGFCGASCDNNPNQHVFLTPDGGATWTDITGTAGGGINNLPDLPVNAVVIDPSTTPHAIVVSNDAGVLQTADQGATWQVLGLGMPTVDVVSLALDSSVTPELLRAGTFGRSAFELAAATTALISVNADLSFGQLCPGASATRQVEVFNVGVKDLHIAGFTRISGSTDFTILPNPATPLTISPDAHVDFTIQFAPTILGPQTATFQINSDDPNTPAFQLTATGSEGNGTENVTGSGIFSTSVCAGTAPTQTLEINNTGACNLNVASATLTGCSSAFTLVNPTEFPAPISPDSSLGVGIQFSPTSGGLQSCSLMIDSDDPVNPVVVVPLSGEEGSGTINVTGSGNFGTAVCGGKAPPQTLKINNTGPCNLNVTSAVISCPDFTLVNPSEFPATISADSGLDVGVNFTPTSAGPKSCTLTITSNDPVNPTVVIPLNATTPLGSASLKFPGGLTFPPTVIQQNAACPAPMGVPVTDGGVCPVQINAVSLTQTSSPADYLLTGLPGLPVTVPAGGQLGSGDLDLVFEPFTLARTSTGTANFTFVNDPITGATATTSVPFCGEGVHRGLRVLVTLGGVPVSKVERIDLQIAFGPEQPHGDWATRQSIKHALLQTVSGVAPCPTFEFHAEFGGVSNPPMLKNGAYRVKVTLKVGKKTKHKVARVVLSVCSFTPNVVVAF